MTSSVEITPELMAGFLDEAPEYLEMLDSGLMELEIKAGSGVLSLDDPEDQERMNVMFRAAHSLKGLAAAFGFEKIKELTHRMETLFDQVRMGKRNLSGERFETLFHVFDRLKALVSELSDESSAPIEIDDILAALDAVLNAQESTNAREPAGESPDGDSLAAETQVAEDSMAPNPAGDESASAGGNSENEVLNDPELAALFVETSMESIDELNQGLLGLEENPSDSELLNTVFRCAHNIKGASGAAGLVGMNRLTHQMETVFDHLRNGRISLCEDLMNAVFKAVDRLRAVIDQFREGGIEDVSPGEMKDCFHPWVAGTEGVTTKEVDAEDLGIKDSEPKPETTAPIGVELVAESELSITVCFPPGFEEAPIQAYLIHNKLCDLGNVLSSDPEIESLSGDSNVNRIVFAFDSEGSSDEIERIIGAYAVESVTVAPRAGGSDPDRPGRPEQSDTATSGEAARSGSEPRVCTASGGRPTPDTVAKDAPVAHEADTSIENQPTEGGEHPTSAGKDKDVARATPSAAVKSEGPAAGLPNAPRPQAKPDAPTQPVRKGGGTPAKTGETLRVDQERLDQLMNLGGELVINRARFLQIHGNFRQVFEGKNLSFLVDDMSDRIGELNQDISAFGENGGRHRNMDEIGNHLLHLTQGFRAVRSFIGQVHDLRSSMADFDEALHSLGRVTEGIQKGIMGTRMVPVGPLFNRFRRVVRDIAKSNGKHVDLVLRGEGTELDKRMIDELGDPLTHMVRNSVDHGLETPDAREAAGKNPTGTIILEAGHRGNSIWIEVRDDGAGIHLERVKAKIVDKGLATPDQVAAMSDRDIYQYIFKPGFSTAEVVTDLSGRGMGMDIVISKIEKLSGTVEVDSTPGQGTHVVIKLPLTLAILTSMVARVGEGVYALPLEAVAEIITVQREQIQWIQRRPVVRVRERVIPIAYFEDIFSTSLSELQTVARNNDELTLVIVGFEQNKIGLVVDELLGQEDVVIKSLAENYENVPGIAGASIRGDGTVSLILDVGAMMDMATTSDGVEAPKTPAATSAPE